MTPDGVVLDQTPTPPNPISHRPIIIIIKKMWQHVTILPGLARWRGLAVEPWVLVDCRFGTARSHETTTSRGYGRPRLLSRGLARRNTGMGWRDIHWRRPSATNAVWIPKSQSCLWRGGSPHFDGSLRQWTQCDYRSPFQNRGQGAMGDSGMG